MSEIKFKDCDSKKLTPVITALINSDKVGALVAYKKETGIDGFECVTDVIEIASMLTDWAKNEDFFEQFCPEVCCKNCSAQCHMFRDATKEGFHNKDKMTFAGARCESFVSIKDFEKKVKNSTIFYKLPKDDKTYTQLRIDSENDLLRLTISRHYTRNDSIIGKAKTKTFKIDEKKLAPHLVKINRICNKIIKITTEKPKLHIFGKKLLKKETYKEYVDRVMKEKRAEAKAIVSKVEAMNYEDCLTYIANEILNNSAKKIVANVYGGFLVDFIRDFFPNQNVWDIVLHHMKG